MKASRAALTAILLVGSLTIRAAEPEPEMETVLVTGEQPGPGLWKVSRDGHVMWVFGNIGALPDTIRWRTREVETRIAESQEVLFPGWPKVSVDIGVLEGLTLVPAAFKAAKNPDGQKLEELLEPDAYAAWSRLRKKYLDDDDDIEKYRPAVAEEKLTNAIGKRMMKGLDMKPVHPVIEKLARKHKVRIHRLPDVVRKVEIEKPRAILKAARDMDLAESACVGRNLVRIEKQDALGLLAFDVAATNAWATGDLEGMRPKPVDPALVREDCWTAAFDAAMARSDSELPAEMRRGLGILKQQEELYKRAGEEAYLNWMAAVETALANNPSTFAVLPMGTALNSKDGWLGKLAERGYTVEGPRGQILEMQ
jgi:hypothetical protein